MGLLDGMLKQALGGGQGGGALGGLIEMALKRPQVLRAVAGLLSTRDASVGGAGGLAGLVTAFQGKGLGDMIGSWISTGPNPPVSASQLTDVLGGETMGQFARQAGVPVGEAGSLLAGLLPAAIDALTPDGKLPDAGALDDTLQSLVARLG